MNTTILKFALVVITFFSFSFVQAQEKKQPDFEKMFKKFDANKDGSISLEEFKSAKRKNEVPAEKLEKNYARMDADSNGALTLDELKSNMGKGKPKGEGKKKKQE